LKLRGIEGVDNAVQFLRPVVGHLCDPFSLTDMDVAVARIARAKDSDEQVLVFADYDVDGIAASAIMHNGLKRFGIKYPVYGMPKRLVEGYGLADEHIEAAARDGISLVITVDNGIASHAAALRAKELGVDLIITDHHASDAGLPEACAIINPKREAPTRSARWPILSRCTAKTA
jgi:single-stranded-DNA-specific exonuclease